MTNQEFPNNQPYEGSPSQYQVYKQLRLQNKLANENLEAAEVNQDAAMDRGGWGGMGRIPPLNVTESKIALIVLDPKMILEAGRVASFVRHGPV